MISDSGFLIADLGFRIWDLGFRISLRPLRRLALSEDNSAFSEFKMDFKLYHFQIN